VETGAFRVSVPYTRGMRDILIIGGVLLLALVVGLVLFLYNPSAGAPAAPSGSAPATASSYAASSPTPFIVLAHGAAGPAGIGQVNYRITSAAQLAQLWQMIYGDNTAPPAVDFSRQEVLAFFDGTHATGGYDIAVTSVADNGARTVNVQHTAPGAGCVVSQSSTAPFEVIQVAKSALAINHVDAAATSDCK
jgi:hypothetical protein